MKKLISIVIISALIFSVSACGKEPAGVRERIAAGEDVYVGYSLETAANPFFIAQADYLRGAFSEVGIRLDYAVSEGDDLKMSEQIAAFADSAVELIICAPAHEETTARALTDAEASGVPVVLMDRKPDYSDRLSGGTYVDWYEAGRELARMASTWISQEYPTARNGSIHAANLFSVDQNIYITQNAGLLQGLQEDPRIVITYNRSDVHTQEAGVEAAQSALLLDPEIKLFFCYQEPSALGVSSAIMSGAELDPSEFAAFSVGLQRAGRAAIDSSKIDESIFRGAITYGVFGASSQLTASETIFIVARDILFGDAPAAPWWVPEDRWAVTGFGYNYLYDNPENDVLLRR